MKKAIDIKAGDWSIRASYQTESERTAVLIEDKSQQPGLDLARHRSSIAESLQGDGVDLKNTTFVERDWHGSCVQFQLEPRDQLAEHAPSVQADNSKYQVGPGGVREVSQSEAERVSGQTFDPSQAQVEKDFQESMNLNQSMYESRDKTRDQGLDPTD